MKLTFSEHAWEDYLYWRKTEKKTLRRINQLIREIQRTPFEGIGKPEPLKHGLSGYGSRRINDEHRVVYKVTEDALHYCAIAISLLIQRRATLARVSLSSTSGHSL